MIVFLKIKTLLEKCILKLSNGPFPHYASVSKHKEMRTRLGLTISYKSLYFVHSSLEWVPLFTGMRERSMKSLTKGLIKISKGKDSLFSFLL